MHSLMLHLSVFSLPFARVFHVRPNVALLLGAVERHRAVKAREEGGSEDAQRVLKNLETCQEAEVEPSLT